jgi:predicted metal-dependent enzyme (double-stranded beta helix superfamily)
LRPTSPVDVHRQTLDAYDSWLLHVESDERDRLRVQACAGGPTASVDGPALLPPVDVHRQTLDAYDSWLLHVESDERDRLRVQACATGLTPRLEITGG